MRRHHAPICIEESLHSPRPRRRLDDAGGEASKFANSWNEVYPTSPQGKKATTVLLRTAESAVKDE